MQSLLPNSLYFLLPHYLSYFTVHYKTVLSEIALNAEEVAFFDIVLSRYFFDLYGVSDSMTST